MNKDEAIWHLQQIMTASDHADAHYETILAALTGSDRPEVDLHKEIMNIPVDENRMSAVIQESRSINKKHNFAVHLYNVAFRDARHAAAGIVAGRWRKVEK